MLVSSTTRNTVQRQEERIRREAEADRKADAEHQQRRDAIFEGCGRCKECHQRLEVSGSEIRCSNCGLPGPADHPLLKPVAAPTPPPVREIPATGFEPHDPTAPPIPSDSPTAALLAKLAYTLPDDGQAAAAADAVLSTVKSQFREQDVWQRWQRLSAQLTTTTAERTQLQARATTARQHIEDALASGGDHASAEVELAHVRQELGTVTVRLRSLERHVAEARQAAESAWNAHLDACLRRAVDGAHSAAAVSAGKLVKVLHQLGGHAAALRTEAELRKRWHTTTGSPCAKMPSE